MKKGFKFNFTLKVVQPDGSVRSTNFVYYERARQEFLYYKNCLGFQCYLICNNAYTVLHAYEPYEP